MSGFHWQTLTWKHMGKGTMGNRFPYFSSSRSQM
jgi:hypothetical protein